MHFSTPALLLGAAGLAQIAAAAYSLQDDYSGNNFFDMFTFDTEKDPTSGYVNYLDASDAQAANLAGVVDDVVTIRSDSSNIAWGHGRDSVRVTSRNSRRMRSWSWTWRTCPGMPVAFGPLSG